MEAEIISKCKEQDRASQKVIYKTYLSKMVAVAYRYTGSYDDAKDIVQDSFILIFDKISTYQGNGSFEGWIKRIVINKAITFINKKKKNQTDGNEDALFYKQDQQSVLAYQVEESNNEDIIYSAGLSKEDILVAINELPSNYKLVFNMHVIDGFAHKIVAEHLGITEELSRIRLKRARTSLQKVLLDIVKNKQMAQANG